MCLVPLTNKKLNMKVKLKALLSGWAIHSGIFLAGFFLFYAERYITSTHAYFKRTPPWEYFIRHAFYSTDYLHLLLSLLFIEINYRYFFKKLRLPVFVLICLLVGVCSLALIWIFNFERFQKWGVPYQLAFYVAGYALVYAIIRDYIHKIRHKKDIQLQQSKSELDTLKAQLNPHFLFNSLNYLYGTALTEQAPQTANGIDKLSEMMRYTITGIHENYVLLENELNFMEHYLELQQARLPQKDSIKIDIQITRSTKEQQIAPLLLLPFIENAFKYGISMDEPCFVTIKILVVGSSLYMEISNSISSKPIEIKGNNTGIKNAIKRLNLLYPDNYKLSQTDNGNEYKTLLTLKLNP